LGQTNILDIIKCLVSLVAGGEKKKKKKKKIDDP
jgi:hypothetical protein